MSTQYESRPGQTQPAEPAVSGWAFGGITFAATVMTLVGIFQALAGLVAILDDEFYVVARNYTFALDVTAWGWIHLIVGIAVFAGGLGLFGRRAWAGVPAIFLAMGSALVNFFFIPYYPIWSLLDLGLAIWVIWALTRPGTIQ
jgi:hypothetical protein